MFQQATFPESKDSATPGDSAVIARNHLEAIRKHITQAFTDATSAYASRLNDIMSRLALIISAKSPYQIPVLHLEMGDWQAYEGSKQASTSKMSTPLSDASKKDPVELLFIRINSAGTPLGGEELIYSLLKSAWVQAPKFIDQLVFQSRNSGRKVCTWPAAVL